MELTQAQRAVWDCLQAEWRAGRAVGSLDHLCRLMGLRSRGALHRHVDTLVAAGLLAPLDRHRHGLRPAHLAAPPDHGAGPLAGSAAAWRDGDSRPRISPPEWPADLPMRALPRLGRIAAGAPLDAVFEDEPMLVPERLTPPGDAYVLEVRGDSMSGDGIMDGDLVIVEVDPHVRAGEIAVVLVAGEGATLKRFRQEGPLFRLIASNPEVADQLIPADQIAIQGRISGLMRNYRN